MTLITQDPSVAGAQETSTPPADVHTVLEQVQKIAESTSERLQELADGVLQQAREQVEKGARVATEHPLALFGTAFAVGVAIGLLLPRE